MINIIMWLAAFLCPNPTHTVENHGNCKQVHITTVSTNADSGGETGGHPPPPFPPPPPPPPPKP